jgi:hypothetical protein
MPDLIPLVDDKPVASILEPGSLSDLAAGGKGTVLSFTNAGPDVAWIDGVRGEADVDFEMFLLIDTVQKEATRASIATPKAEISYPTPQRLEVGQLLEVKVEHHIDGELGNFRATLFGHRD